MPDTADGFCRPPRPRPRGRRRDEDDRPPICPACGVTMGIVVGADGTATHVCQECGYPDGDAA